MSVSLSAMATSAYTIYGNVDSGMEIPPAYQCATPFGANTGGTNPAFWAVANNAALGYAQFDSWLTVGLTDGDAGGAISSIGIDFQSWSESTGLSVNDGAVFWMTPDNAPAGDSVVAQITVAAGSSGTVTMGMQGRSPGTAEDWRANNIQFSYP